MELKSCKSCKSLFYYYQGEPICEKCQKEEASLLKVLKDYLEENPHSSMQQIYEDLEISPQLITKFIKQGVLIVSEKSPITVTCQRCHIPIQVGQYCVKCKKELSDTMEKVSQQMKSSLKTEETNTKENKLRFLNSDRIKQSRK